MRIEDRRVFSRINLKVPLKFLAPYNKMQGEGVTVDISANGVGFITTEKLSPNTRVEIWLNLPQEHGDFYTRGEIVWSQPINNSIQHRIGVQLEKEELMGLAQALWFSEKNYS